jgi:hypothetical protein
MIRALAVVLLVTGVAQAQEVVDLDLHAVTAAKAGAWAEYKISVRDRKKTSKMRYALVGKGDNWMVLEIETQADKGPVLMRLEYALTGPGTWSISSGRIMAGKQKRDLSPDELRKSAPLSNRSEPGELVGSEKVTTPAGTFDCFHYQKQIELDGGKLAVHLWMSERAGPTGLVKSVAPLRGIEVVLAKVGTGAVSKLK